MWDPRPANEDEFFHMADHRLRCSAEELADQVQALSINAAMVMTHSVPMDAQTLEALSGKALDYVGLLGPIHRREEIFEAGLIDADFKPAVDGPAGFDIGGELPESIALSVIAKCHDAIFGSGSRSGGKPVSQGTMTDSQLGIVILAAGEAVDSVPASNSQSSRISPYLNTF